MNAPHIPVLLEEVLHTFRALDGGYFIDCTLGYGGHTYSLLSQHPRLHILGIDRDDEALRFSSERLQDFHERVTLIKGDFASTVPTLHQQPVTGLLADFGVSSLQLDKLDRGFGFESPLLDMRMDMHSELTAHHVINTYSRKQLHYIFTEYGEIRAAAKLADAIIAERTRHPIESALQLSTLARNLLGNHGKIHPATLLFQAIRIEVNDELGQIEKLLDALESMQPAGAIISLITFHSLEDRLVKRRFKKWAQSCMCDPHALRCTCGNDHSLGTIQTRKPIVARQKEIRTNPRSRSAKLRTFVFKDPHGKS
jgi:16S rRNA (cytosine1402-N4)-methyltransferase